MARASARRCFLDAGSRSLESAQDSSVSEDRAAVRRVAYFGAARKVAALMRRPSSNGGAISNIRAPLQKW